jgi:hypothetical protein
VAAIWSKKATVNKQLVKTMEGMMEGKCSWGEVYGVLFLFMQGGKLSNAKNAKIKNVGGLRWLCYNI